MLLPVRRKNGTPDQRQLSISRAHGDEGLGLGVGVNALALAVARVLAADHAVGADRLHRAEDLAGLLDDRAPVERGRRLHGHEAEHVEEVRDDHVAVGAGLLVEAGAVVDRERLRDVDLDVVDVVLVPDRLEHAVGEAQRDQVLDRLAPEEVVDPEDALLVEDAVHELVERDRALQVDAERLLEHDPRAVREPGGAERLDRRAEGVRAGSRGSTGGAASCRAPSRPWPRRRRAGRGPRR